MMLGRKIITTLGAVTLAFSVQAGSKLTPTCPNPSLIKNTGVSMAVEMEISLGYFVGLEQNNYSSDDKWFFAIGPVLAQDENEAIAISNDLLSGLSGPVDFAQEDDVFVCLYEVTGNPGVRAIAGTGDINLPIKSTAKRLILRHRKQ